MDFEAAVEKGIQLRERENRERWQAEDADGKFHVSDLTGCPRYVLQRRRKAPPTNRRPLVSTLVQEVGKQFHELLQDAHRRAGTLVRADFQDAPWTVSDGILRGHPDLLTLLSMDRGLELWDIKSLKEGGYRTKGGHVIDTVKGDDGEQLNAYMALTGVHQGGIVYVNRNSGEFTPVAWRFDEALWRDSLKKLAGLKKWDEGNGLPEPLDPAKFPCTYSTKDGVRVDCIFYSGCHPDRAVASRLEQEAAAP